jgi:hypothetical protein
MWDFFIWRHLILKLSLSICRERARKKKEEEERRMEREREKVFSQLSLLPYCYLGAPVCSTGSLINRY